MLKCALIIEFVEREMYTAMKLNTEVWSWQF